MSFKAAAWRDGAYTNDPFFSTTERLSAVAFPGVVDVPYPWLMDLRRLVPNLLANCYVI